MAYQHAAVPTTIPTGVATLDLALFGGLRRGRLVEIFGPERTGMEALTYHILAEAQQLGCSCALVDVDDQLDRQQASRIGVDTNQLGVSTADDDVVALQRAKLVVDATSVDVIAVNLSMLPGEAIAESPGRELAHAIRELVQSLRCANTLCVVANPTNDAGFRPARPGGRALRFYSFQRLSLELMDASVFCRRVRAKVVMNKMGIAPPSRHAMLDVELGADISPIGCALDLAVRYGIVTVGDRFRFGRRVLGDDRVEAKNYLRAHPKIAGAITARAHDHMAQEIEAELLRHEREQWLGLAAAGHRALMRFARAAAPDDPIT